MPRYPTIFSRKKINYFKPKISESTFVPGSSGSQQGVPDCYGEPVRWRSRWKKRKDKKRKNHKNRSDSYPKFTGYEYVEKKYEWIENRIGDRIIGWIHPKYHYTVWNSKDTSKPEPFMVNELKSKRFK